MLEDSNPYAPEDITVFKTDKYAKYEHPDPQTSWGVFLSTVELSNENLPDFIPRGCVCET